MEAAISTATMLRNRHFGISSALSLTGIARFFCALIFLAVTNSALATSYTWDGLGGNVNWGGGSNWTIGSAPISAATTDLFFDGSTNTGTAGVPLNQNIATPFLLNSLTFNLGAGSFYLGGGALRFDGGATNTIVQNSPNAQNIANGINAPSTNGSVTLTLAGNGAGVVTMSGIIASGNGARDYAITKNGTSTFVLSGVNTYGGVTTINAGVLNIQNATALGGTTAGTTVASGAALQIQGGIIVGAETLTLNGSGVAADGALRNISGNNSYGGAITLALASTIASDAGTLTISSTLVNGGFTFTLAGAGNITASSIVSGTGAFIKNGSGTVTLSGVNTFSGGSTMNGGTVVINSSSSLGATAGAATINAATLEVSATFTSTRSFTLGNTASTVMVDPTFTFTANGIFNGTGALNKTGTGTLILGSANSYTGATNISAGILKEGIANVIPNTSAVTVSSGATYDLNSFTETIGSLAGGGTVTSGAAGALTLTAGGDNTSTLFSGILQNGSGTFSLTKSGTGTFTLSGANTYTGLTTVAGGTLVIQSNTALGTTTGATTVSSGATLELQSNITVGAEPLTLNGPGVSNFGALRNLSGNNSFGGAITVASATTIYSDAGNLTLSGGIANGGFTVTFGGSGNTSESGVISGTAGLAKNGTGTLVLTGTNTYSGATTVNGGTLTVAGGPGGGLTSTSSITVNAGGTVLLGASDQINNGAPITLAGGTFAKGNFSEGTASGPGLGALTLTATGSKIDFGTGTVGVVTLASFTPGTFTLGIDNWTGTVATAGGAGTDRLIFASDQSGNLNSFWFTGYAPGAVEFSLGGGYYEVTPAAIPETSTWITAALALGAAGFQFVRRRRAKAVCT